MSAIVFNPTPQDRELIRGIQSRVGIDPTGEIDHATLLAITETFDVAHEFFARFFGTKRNNFSAAATSERRRDPAAVPRSTE